MKFSLLTILLLFVSAGRSFAQANYEPAMNNSQSQITISSQYSIFMDPIYGYGTEENTTNFASRNYWYQRAAARPYDELAWFNYYKATRYISEGGLENSELQPELDSIEGHLRKYVPGTWEQLIVEYWNSNRDPLKEQALLKANTLRPFDPLTLRMMTGFQYIHNNYALLSDYYLKWKNTGDTPLSTENYAYNVLQSLPADAIVFTNGEMDTYPLIYQAQANKSAVKVISLAWCERMENRKNAFANAGLVLPADADFNDRVWISNVAAANPGKKIYVASTCDGAILTALSSSLYCTGLAFRYSDAPVDHLVFLRNNVGTKMKLDFVGKAVRSTNHFDMLYAAQLEMNYYLPLLMAADSYAEAGNAKRAGELRAKAKAVRERAGYDEPIRNEGE